MDIKKNLLPLARRTYRALFCREIKPKQKEDQMSTATQKLTADFNVLTDDVQELLKTTTSVVGEKAAEARAKVTKSLKVAQDKFTEVQAEAQKQGKKAIKKADEYAQHNPWVVIAGVAAFAGFITGIAIAARVRR
jgi:ElaB/YqjD/DUF883 family membrane-anchored ribosome-binding protein